MIIQDTAGRLFHPGLLADIPTGRLVWVDGVHGNDDGGKREQRSLPFKTLTAAKTAAVSGDTIMVLPGEYNENNLAKGGVNWHFLPGAVIDFASAISANAIFSADGLASFKITGAGVFKTTSGAGAVPAIFMDSTTDITFEFDRVEVGGVAISAGEGTLRARGNVIESAESTINASQATIDLVVREIVCTSATDPAIQCDGGQVIVRAHRITADAGGIVVGGSADLQLDAFEILAGDEAAVVINGATAQVQIRASKIYSENGYGVQFLQGSYARIEAFEVRAENERAVLYDADDSGQLHLAVKRIVSNYDDAAGEAVYIADDTDKVYLYGCTLLVNDSGPSFSIDATASAHVKALGPLLSNFAEHNITFRGYSTLTVASQIT